jgi:rod shape-determining protein MreC
VRTSRNFYSRYVNKNSYAATLIPLILIVFSLIFYFGRFDNSIFLNEIRTKSINSIHLITSIVSSPVSLIKDGLVSIYEIQNIYKENKKFKEMQLLDSANFQEMVSMKLKIAQYEKLLNVSSEIQFDFITSRIVGDFSNNFNGTLIINAGKEENVEADMPVSGSIAIIGRVSHVSENLSRVLLLSNVNSRIPVIVSDEGYDGILIGQGRENPTVRFIEDIEKISIGDLVTTSGKGGIFPPFQLIGQVVGKKNNEIEINLFEDITSLSHVKLLNYKLENES